MEDLRDTLNVEGRAHLGSPWSRTAGAAETAATTRPGAAWMREPPSRSTCKMASAEEGRGPAAD